VLQKAAAPDFSSGIPNTATKEMENISRGHIFADFAILTQGLMQDITLTRLQSTKVQTPLSPLY
jgi:hypothetical protein